MADGLKLTNSQIEILQLLTAGKRILREGDLWQLYEPSLSGSMIETHISYPPGGNDAIDALIRDGYAVAYQSIAGEYHGYLLRGLKRPPIDYLADHNPRNRVLYWSDCHQLYLTEKGRMVING